jgi:hypothetical protein
LPAPSAPPLPRRPPSFLIISPPSFLCLRPTRTQRGGSKDESDPFCPQASNFAGSGGGARSRRGESRGFLASFCAATRTTFRSSPTTFSTWRGRAAARARVARWCCSLRRVKGAGARGGAALLLLHLGREGASVLAMRGSKEREVGGAALGLCFCVTSSKLLPINFSELSKIKPLILSPINLALYASTCVAVAMQIPIPTHIYALTHVNKSSHLVLCRL